MMTKKKPNPTDVHVGSRVRMRRMMLSMSQEKLGDALGLTFQQVQKYEKGTNRIGASRLQQIAGALDVAPSFFFEGAPDAHGKPSASATPDFAQAFLATTDGLAIARAFPKLTPKLRRSVADLVEEMAA